MRTPLQIHRDREEKKDLVFKIKDAQRLHQLTLKDEYRIKIITYCREYKIKYKKDYKGG